MIKGDGEVLVAGATGFIGYRLCQRLQREGYSIVALGRHEKEGPWSRFLKVDLEGGPLPLDSLDGVSTLFHLAGKAHSQSRSGHGQGYRESIFEGTRRLVSAACELGIDRFIYVSSVKAMGEGNHEGSRLMPLDEDSPHLPQDQYGQAKFDAEKLVLASGLGHPVVLRPCLVYGSASKGNLSRMRHAIRRGSFPPVPETGNKRSMIHVDDLVEFLVRAAERPTAAGKTYILASQPPVSTRELYDAMRHSLEMPPVRWSVPLWAMRLAANLGSAAGGLTGRQMPFDREVYLKVFGSAWYSAERAEKDLEFTARTSVLDWLESGKFDQ